MKFWKALIVQFLLMDKLVQGKRTQWKGNAKDQRYFIELSDIGTFDAHFCWFCLLI